MADSTDTARVTVTVVGLTDVGQVRDHNEDNFVVLDRSSGKRLANGEQATIELEGALVMAVCDGMGGAAAGEVASQMAVDRAVKDLGGADYSTATPDQVMVLLEAAVQNANSDILAEAEKNTERKGMGTTMTAGVAVPGQICIAQVGDSRGYLLRSGQLVQLTKDQSLIGQLIEEGTLTEEEAEALGGRNIVLQAVGVEEHLKVDTRPFDIRRGDLILMCSDGLNGMLKDKEMEEIVNASVDDLPTAARNLVQAANDNGGKDNITVTLARFEGDGLKPPLATFSADDVDRGEGVFKAPEAVDVPNPMKKVGLILALIIVAILVGFVLARRTTVDIPLRVSPGDLPVKVVITDEEGNEVATQTVNSGSGTIKGLPTGKYTLRANVEKYHEDVQILDLQKPGTARPVKLRLVPHQATVTISSATPHVQVTIQEEDATDPLKTVSLDRAGAEQKERLPADKTILFTASRSGFEAVTIEQAIAPDGTHTVHFDALKPILAKLPIETVQEGVKVEIQDEHGEPLDTWISTKAGDKSDRNVRVGKVRIKGSKSGYEDLELDATVEGGGATNAVVRIALQVSPVSVAFHSSRKFAVEFLRKDPKTGQFMPVKGRVFVTTKSPKGFTGEIPLPPGEYTARYPDADGNKVDQPFTVPEASKGITVELTK